MLFFFDIKEHMFVTVKSGNEKAMVGHFLKGDLWSMLCLPVRPLYVDLALWAWVACPLLNDSIAGFVIKVEATIFMSMPIVHQDFSQMLRGLGGGSGQGQQADQDCLRSSGKIVVTHTIQSIRHV